MIGIVNKPQFDKDVFTIGKAIHLKKFTYNHYTSINDNALVVDCTPLELTVVYVSKNEGTQYENIGIDEMNDSTYEITELKEER